MKEPHPADIKATCNRCNQRYFLADGCECYDLSDEEIESRKEAQAEAAIERYKETFNCIFA
jgi:hypothetical protein